MVVIIRFQCQLFAIVTRRIYAPNTAMTIQFFLEDDAAILRKRWPGDSALARDHKHSVLTSRGTDAPYTRKYGLLDSNNPARVGGNTCTDLSVQSLCDCPHVAIGIRNEPEVNKGRLVLGASADPLADLSASRCPLMT